MGDQILLDNETQIFLDDLAFDGTITPCWRALSKLTQDDVLQLQELKKKFWRIDPTEDREDGGVITLGVLGEIDRLLKEIIGRTPQ